MRHIFATVSGGALACALAISPALAQQDTPTSPAGAQGENQMAMGNGDGGTHAGALTCAHLNSIDAAEIPGLLYFVQGFAAGRSTGGEQPAAAGSERTATSNEGAEPAPQNEVAAGDAAPAAQAPEAESSAETRTAGGGEGGAGPEAGGDPQAGGEEMQATAVAGFSRIPIEQTVVACAESPDSTVAEVIEQQQGSAGSESRGG